MPLAEMYKSASYRPALNDVKSGQYLVFVAKLWDEHV